MWFTFTFIEFNSIQFNSDAKQINKKTEKNEMNEWKISSFCQWFTKFKSINDDDVIYNIF